MRIDLHVHTKFSKRPTAWFLKKIGCPESFTEPLDVFRIARSRGMDAVTITDHNGIQGALEIAHLPKVFISEEVTTYFPENRCKLHVLTLGIDEKQHADIQKARGNVFELVNYLIGENIVHVLAHPLYRINNRLSMSQFEQLLLLFRHFEINGARNGMSNDCLRAILASLTPALMDRLADRHALAPTHLNSWEKIFTGGSDDHSGLHIAQTFTEVEAAENTTDALIDGLRKGNTRAITDAASPATMAHNFYGIAYQFYRNKFKLDRYADKDVLIRFLDHTLLNCPDETRSGLRSRLYYFWNHRKITRSITDVPDSLLDLLRMETHKLLSANPQLMQLAKTPETDSRNLENKWFDFVNQVTNRTLLHFGNHLMDHLSGANVFNIFNSLGSAGGLYTLLAPYFVAFSLFTDDRDFNRRLSERFAVQPTSDSQRRVKVAHFTDTLYEINGVALTLRQQVRSAMRNGKQLEVITCKTGDHPPQPGIKTFQPVGVYELPEYPELDVLYPPILEMLDYCYRMKFTRIHSATPGPIGLAALAIARILKLPIYGTYHTALPQYAKALTGESVIEDLTWRYMIWYYAQMDVIYAPSESTREELAAKGIPSEKIRVYPRGIDIRKFHPAKRNGLMASAFNIPSNTRKLLYVGRVSREKNLHILANVFRSLCEATKNVHLVIVGDGPYLGEMKNELVGTPCTFAGYLEGEKLAEVYASSDIFVFPSTTDTFGNVVLEAQASGLPVIVTDQGGPVENMHPGQTGLVAQGDSAESLLDKILLFISNPEMISRMAREARNYMEERSFDAAFIRTWEMYRNPEISNPANASSA